MPKRYVDNVREMLRRRGLAAKYEHPGIYCIKVRGQIVYIGKSKNMLERIAEHYVEIKKESEDKYRVLAEVQRQGLSIDFDVLYYAKSINKADVINEIGEKEGELIRAYRPVLNTQIPRKENWRKWDVKEVDAREVLKLLLDDK